MTSLHTSLRRRHGLKKDDLAHHCIALKYPRFIDSYLPTYVKKGIKVGFRGVRNHV